MEEKKELHFVELAYERVSTKNQSLERQETSILEAVPDLKAKYFFKDKYTGKEFNRPEYLKLKEKILELLEANPNTNIRVTIHELDRIGRDYAEIQKEVHWFRGHGVTLRFLVDDVYKVLLELGEGKAEENAVYQDETGVYLTRAEIEEAVNCMGYDFLGIRELFERRNLWIKDKGSAGYQFSKKIDGKKVHFYKLRKVSGSEEIAVNTEFCMKYTEDKE